MLRRLRRPLALVAPLLLVSGLVASCGGDNGPDNTADRLDAVAISGDVGASPDVEWKSEMAAAKPEVETLVEGDGKQLAKGGQALVNYWLGDGYTQQTVFDSFGADDAGFRLTVGGEPEQPITVNDLVSGFVSTQIEAGVTRGTRLAITANSTDVFGQNVLATPVAAENIGNDEALLIIVDVLDTKILSKPEGEKQPPAPWAPKLVSEKGVPTALDFARTDAPNDQLRTAVLTQGTGDVVEKGDVMVANYLGYVYEGDEPFDESFSSGPFAKPIGLGQLVKGWDQALVGQPVGSRVLLQIPPKLGYGKKGQGETIPPDSTLYFVIDILAAA